MTRRRRRPEGPRFACAPYRGVRRCAQCGYDHDDQFERARAWHEAHDAGIGEAHDGMSLERIRR